MSRLDFDAPRAALMRENRDKAVHLAVEFQLLSDLAAHRFQRAAEIVDREAGCFGNQPVRHHRRQPAAEAFVPAVLAPAMHQVVAFIQLLAHHRNIARFILQVAIERDNDVAEIRRQQLAVSDEVAAAEIRLAELTVEINRRMRLLAERNAGSFVGLNSVNVR